MKLKFRESTLFLYALGISLIAFISNSIKSIMFPSLINGIVGFALGRKKLPQKLLVTLLLLNVWGAFLNGLYFHNTGEVIISTQVIIIREGAIKSFLLVSLRFFLVVGATLLMLGLTNMRDLIKSLERDLRIPPGIAFTITYAFRLFPLLSRDLSEVYITRKERGFSSMILNPKNLKSILLPLLNLGYERAVWGGISAELRGLGMRRIQERKSLSLGDFMIFCTLILQWILALI
ncbi:MAG: energy-coupling factor transporter transmembrane component T [Desulfurococcaceae archaeon TW002]